MKRTAVLLCMFVFLLSPKTEALIVDLPDAEGVGFFKDLSTGYTWMDIDNFFGLTYTQINNVVFSTQFHIATLTEINQLKASAPANPSLFAEHASIMGGSSTRNLIWGYYDDDGDPSDGGSWNFKWGPNNLGEPANIWFTPISSGTNEAFSDLGAWVVNSTLPETPVIPEPGTLALLSTGLLGILGNRRFLK